MEKIELSQKREKGYTEKVGDPFLFSTQKKAYSIQCVRQPDYGNHFMVLAQARKTAQGFAVDPKQLWLSVSDWKVIRDQLDEVFAKWTKSEEKPEQQQEIQQEDVPEGEA